MKIKIVPFIFGALIASQTTASASQLGDELLYELQQQTDIMRQQAEQRDREYYDRVANEQMEQLRQRQQQALKMQPNDYYQGSDQGSSMSDLFKPVY